MYNSYCSEGRTKLQQIWGGENVADHHRSALSALKDFLHVAFHVKQEAHLLQR